ncbi:MAG: arginine decarboxylase, partial [Acidobacteriota bacterium]
MDRVRKDGRWRIKDSLELYGIDTWGREFLDVNEDGHLVVGPTHTEPRGIDLKKLVDEVVERGVDPPFLFRFSDLLDARLDAIHGAFQHAIDEYGYRGVYRGVYPIKVNQNRYLVQDLV